MTGIGFVILAIIYFVLNADTSDMKFELLLENITECPHPQPPYGKKRHYMSEFNISRQGADVLLSGQNRVLAEVPFLNFSVRSFAADRALGSARPQQVFEITKVNCRNWRGKLFLKMGGFRYNPRTCLMKKGIYPIKNINLNKMAHAVPGWHAEGTQWHQYSMVQNGVTIFCNDISISVKEWN